MVQPITITQIAEAAGVSTATVDRVLAARYVQPRSRAEVEAIALGIYLYGWDRVSPRAWWRAARPRWGINGA